MILKGGTGSPGSNGMGTEVPLFHAKIGVADCFGCIANGINNVFTRDVFDLIVSPDGRHWGVVVCSDIGSDSLDNSGPGSDWAHDCMMCYMLCDSI
eukprot:scaffold61423_cov46-Cyclotella_meneghiniana.AAC.1